MANIDIKTVLGVCPKPKKHEVIIITRGATASFDFDLTTKVYDFNDIEQFTVLFGTKDIVKFDMLEYFRVTEDLLARTGKIYYERFEINNPKVSYYEFKPKAVNVGESVVGLYEQTCLKAGETTDNWQINSHFAVDSTGKWINFILTAKETIDLFKPTDCLKFETATRLNTDYLFRQKVDSTVIDKYHDLVVVNSLFGKAMED